MPRKYTVSQAVIERNRKGAAATNSLDRYVQRIVDSAPELTPEQLDKLRALLRPTGGAAE
ncbi:hypothetical protein ABZY20_18900 [Streptomyces sp. NPDC006624]|uniref:hypothetical protein n=1 Tax=Streptomyces sp. NPDC006624 TaxID=3154892 RepID=UPI0033B0352C